MRIANMTLVFHQIHPYERESKSQVNQKLKNNFLNNLCLLNK